MRIRTSAGIALVAGAVGLAGTVSAGHEASASVIRIGGGSGVTVSVSVGAKAASHWLGTLTIDGCEFVIYECDDVEREIVRAFRREGYRASEYRGVITVDFRRRAPKICWHSHDYDLKVRETDCDEITLRLIEKCDHLGVAIGDGGRGRDVRERISDRRDRDDDRGDRNDRRRDVHDRDDRDSRDSRARPRMNLEPYRPATTQSRPRIIGAWVPEPPKEGQKD